MLNRAMKRLFAGRDGRYAQYDQSSGHVASVQASRHALRSAKLLEKQAFGASAAVTILKFNPGLLIQNKN